ncbi:serine hydrolase domain-containing protein [Amycolatopsis nigrescens]|uniref:serine hydrolase domain-containing protein n=1 Tax=Amycolatopsis nigrescens TaxID=381445 RepID=UPI000360A2E7|nr:serine hydrolase domain-containing protein [Amycolatopsis nigrescens]
MNDLGEAIDELAAETGFSGVVRVDRGAEVRLAKAYGLAHRGWGVPNALDTRFAVASGTKGLTALTVVSLIEQGLLEPATTARSVLGPDLPLIDDAVTVEQLLTHRSGIGDYFDEEAEHDITDHVLPVGVHELATSEQYLRVLGGHPQKFAPGHRFSYSNGGFAVLAVLAERVSGVPFHELVKRRVCDPAGLRDTEFLRSDALPGRTATGYFTPDGLRTNIFHLPVRGSGDGGCYSTAADVHALWAAFFAGRIVSANWVAEMVRPHSETPHEFIRYGLGFWLYESTGSVKLEGCDAGVSFRSVHDPVSELTHTVLSNTADGAWPITRRLAELLGS